MRVGTKISKLILTLTFAGILLGCGGNTPSDNKSPKGDGKKDLKAKLDNDPPQNAPSEKPTIPSTLQEAIGGFRLQIENKNERYQISFNQKADAWAVAKWLQRNRLWKVLEQGKVKITGLKVILIEDDSGDEMWVKFASKNPQKGDKVELGRRSGRGEGEWKPFDLAEITKHSAKSLTESFSKQTAVDKNKGDAFSKNRNNMRNAAQLVKALISYEVDNPNLQFPDFDKWCDAILRDAGTLAVFYSPQYPDTAKLKELLPEGKRVSHYSLNKVMSGKDSNDPEMVLVFECDLGWNGSGELEDALKYMEKHKLGKIVVSTADGSSHSVTKEELKKLKWEVSP